MTTMQWALYGSIIFEGIALAHRIALFSTMTLQSYGALVSILSIIHFANHIADLGATNSLPALFPYFTKNKDHFKAMIFSHTIIPHLPIVLVISIASLMYIHHTFSDQYAIVCPMLFASLIATESIAAFLRQFLYTIQDVKAVVILDLSMFCIRIGSLWALFCAFNIALTPTLILHSHLISTMLYICLTSWRLKIFYDTLPMTLSPSIIPSQRFLLSTKISNYALRLSRNIFTANFLTPLFALHFGLSTAGIFYFASKLAHFFVSIVKITIGYTGNGLLAASKEQSFEQCKKVFEMLARRLLRMSTPVFVFFIVAGPVIGTYWYGEVVSQKIFILSTLFLIIATSECFFILYECFYIIQHAASHLFVIKIAEVGILYLLVSIVEPTSATTMLCGIICIRLSTLSMIMVNAYRRWQIGLVI